MTLSEVRFLDRRTPPKLITLILVTSLSVLSMNAFIPSLPALAEDLNADYAFIQLAVSGYLGVTAAMQLVIGPLSDRYGRRPVLIGGFMIFVVASIACTLAPDAESFMVFRMIQAAVATGMVLSRAMVRDMYDGPQAASMIGYMTAAMALVPMVAPLYGGLMEATFGWRATFVSFVFFGLLVLTLVWFDLGETNRQKTASFTAQIKAYPLLFGARRFWGYAATAAFASGSFFALLGGGPYVAREILGLSPEMTGVYLGVISSGYLIGNLLTGRFATKFGVNKMMLMGCTIAATGMTAGLVVNLMGATHPFAIFGFAIFVGLGNGLTLPSATTGLLSVRPELAGSASGLGASMMIGGGAALSAITGALLSPTSGATPLMAMMALSAVLSVFSTIYVIRRAKAVGAE